jgi:hypothetical protein
MHCPEFGVDRLEAGRLKGLKAVKSVSRRIIAEQTAIIDSFEAALLRDSL